MFLQMRLGEYFADVKENVNMFVRNGSICMTSSTELSPYAQNIVSIILHAI